MGAPWKALIWCLLGLATLRLARGDSGDLWALIIDAGSTGSRLYAYHLGSRQSNLTGGVSIRRGKKVRPGLAAFAYVPPFDCLSTEKTCRNNASEAVEQMAWLLEDGSELVPEAKRNETTAIVRCTGGVRDELQEVERRALLNAISAGLSSIRGGTVDVGVVSGDDEAFYAFAAANFLEERVDHLLRVVASDSLVGALDLGGSSTQITYATLGRSCPGGEQSIAERVSRTTHLFAKSYAGLGAQAIRERLLSYLAKTGTHADPCSHIGYYADGLGGSGNLDECAAAIRTALLGPDRATDCGLAVADASSNASLRRASCSIDDETFEPPPATTFLAMCNFFYAADAVRVLAPSNVPPIDDWPTPHLDKLETAARAFCAVPWDVVETTMAGRHSYTPDNLLPSRCFAVTYVLVLLRDVYGLDDFPRVTFALDGPGGADLEWTLGFYLSEIVAPSLQPTM